MIYSKKYARQTPDGAWRIGDSDISLDSVVVGFQQGESPETIQKNYPGLTLEEVYGAVAFYLANRAEVNEYLEHRKSLWDELREKSRTNPSPVVARLRALAHKAKTTAP
ncbi:MAG TPA: DUF433 domain-containing protein [Pirellulaceae bacterium]